MLCCGCALLQTWLFDAMLWLYPSASVAPGGKFCALLQAWLGEMLIPSKRTSTVSKSLTKPRDSRSQQLSRGLIFNKTCGQRNLFTRDVCTSPRPQVSMSTRLLTMTTTRHRSLNGIHCSCIDWRHALASYSTFHPSQPRPQQSPVSKAGAGAVDVGVDLLTAFTMNGWLNTGQERGYGG